MTPQLNTTPGSTIPEYASSSYSARAHKRSRNDDVSDGGRRSVEPSSSRSKRQSKSKEEQKSTRPKPPLSCGECRRYGRYFLYLNLIKVLTAHTNRLKLKCDRVSTWRGAIQGDTVLTQFRCFHASRA